MKLIHNISFLAWCVVVSFGAGGCASSEWITSYPPVSAQSRGPYGELKSRIDVLIADSLFPPAQVGIKIVSVARDEVLYELNSRSLFTPASNMKLFTAAAALKTFGGGSSLFTTFSASTSGIPTIVVTGGGDPMTTASELDSIVRVLVPLLDPGVTYNMVGNVTAFDSIYWGTGWMWDDEPDPTAPFVSALSLNGNTVKVTVAPASLPDAPPSVRLDPSTSFIDVVNTAVTVTGSVPDPLTISRQWSNNRNAVTITGKIALSDTSRTRSFSVREPEMYFLQVLAEKLQGVGVSIGRISKGRHHDTTRPLMQFGHPVDSVIILMNKTSNNLAAEALLKRMDLAAQPRGASTGGGIRTAKSVVAGQGIDTARLVMMDGSGVSRYNLVSPEMITSLLTAMANDSNAFARFYYSLPIAGVDGTLEHRMRGTPAALNVRAKTGSLSGVSSLSGYVTTADGELLAFSMMMQNFPGRNRPYRDVQDAIAIFLSQLQRRDL